MIRDFFSSHLFVDKKFSNFIYIVGAQKAGTSSLHAFLEAHSDIVGAKGKEAHFFDLDIAYAKGLTYYYSYFSTHSLSKFALDSTPSYLYDHKVPCRIHGFQPKAKIIILLREPVSRAFSAYNMYKQAFGNAWFAEQLVNFDKKTKEFFLPIAEGAFSPSIDYFLEYELDIISGNKSGEEPALIRRGVYAPQVRRYVELFGLDNVLILFSADLKNKTEETVDRVFSFLGLEACASIDFSPRHVREYTVDEPEKEEIRRAAEELFAEDKRNLLKEFQLEVPW